MPREKIRHKAKLKPKPAPQPTADEFADYKYEVSFSLEGFRIEDESGDLGANIALTLRKVVENYIRALPIKRTISEIEVKDLLYDE